MLQLVMRRVQYLSNISNSMTGFPSDQKLYSLKTINPKPWSQNEDDTSTGNACRL